MMSLPKSWLVDRARVLLERRHEHVACRRCRCPSTRAPAAPGGRCLRLLEEAGQPILVVDLQHAEAVRFLGRHLDRRERRAGAALAVEPQHLARSPSCRRDRPRARSGAADPRAGWNRGSGRPRRPCRGTSARRPASAGCRISTNSPSSSATTLHPMRMWRLSESDLYCSAMKIRRRPELMQLLSVKSMMR